MIQAGKLQVEWFGSLKRVTYNFGRLGLNTIKGLNGAGKSSIFNAFTWCVYKQTLKKKCTIEPWPHILDDTYKGTKVSFTWKNGEDEYTIIRCQNYKGKVLGSTGKNRLVFLHNGEQVKVKYKGDIQKEIIKAWGYSFDLFKAAVAFGQKIDRFMEEDGPGKKKVFDEAFESAFITRAKELVENRLKQKQKDYDRAQNKYESNRQLLKSYAESYRELKQVIRLFKETRRGKILELRKKVEESEKRIENLKNAPAFKKPPNPTRAISRHAKMKAKLEKLKSREFDYTLRINRSEQEADELNTKLGLLKEEYKNPPKRCDKCGQPLPQSKIKRFRDNLRNRQKAILTELGTELGLLTKLKDKHDAIQTRIDGYQPRVDKANERSLKAHKAELEKGLLEERIKAEWATRRNLLQQIESLKTEKPPVRNLKKSKSKLLEAKRKQAANKEALRHCKKAVRLDQWLIKDPLGNSGLKAFIFDSMMSKVNNYLQAYKTLIGFEVRVEVDLKGSRKDIDIVIHKDGDDVPYEDLSGGQGQLVGVAILFALSDTVQANKPINILLMDEVFESLDKDNIPRVEDIILKKAKTKCVHLITHNDNFNPLNAYKTTLELQSGATVITNRFRDN